MYSLWARLLVFINCTICGGNSRCLCCLDCLCGTARSLASNVTCSNRSSALIRAFELVMSGGGGNLSLMYSLYESQSALLYLKMVLAMYCVVGAWFGVFIVSNIGQWSEFIGGSTSSCVILRCIGGETSILSGAVQLICLMDVGNLVGPASRSSILELCKNRLRRRPAALIYISPNSVWLALRSPSNISL